MGFEKTLSGKGDFGGLNFVAKVYPFLAPPLSIPPDTYNLGFVTINVGEASVDAGVFVKLNVGVEGTLGFRQKTCSVLAEDQAGCFYGDLNNQIDASIAAEAKVSASVTLDCGGASWCTGKFALSGALVGGDASLPLSVSQVKYNSDSCTEGLSGGLVQLGSFKLKNGINLSFAYTDEAGTNVTYSYSKDFVACSFQDPGGFGCDWQY
jgi:hypothetical protein